MSCSRRTEVLPLVPRDTPKMTNYDADSNHYKHISIIGKGLDDNAVVSAMKYVPNGQFVAVKRIMLENLTSNIDFIRKEIIDTRQLKHANILTYYSSFVSNNEVWTVMPLMRYGSTRDLLNTYFSGGLPELAILFILKDVLKGLDYIHKIGIIHRSIKASHILICESGRAVLSGLRYSCNMLQNGCLQRVVHKFPEDCFKNLNWLSPEVLQQNLQGYNSKSDIYSLAITICELANGIVPFSEMPSTKMLVEKLKGTKPSIIEDELNNTDGDTIIKRFSQGFHELVSCCLDHDPELRPSASQILSHPIFKQCKRSSVTFREIITAINPIVDISGNKDAADVDQDLDTITDKLDNVEFDISWTF